MSHNLFHVKSQNRCGTASLGLFSCSRRVTFFYAFVEQIIVVVNYHVIFLLEEGKAVWTYVDVVHSNISSFAITGCRRKETALEEGSIVITSGNMNLADGTSVQAVKP